MKMTKIKIVYNHCWIIYKGKRLLLSITTAELTNGIKSAIKKNNGLIPHFNYLGLEVKLKNRRTK
jgi:hypothetical protein